LIDDIDEKLTDWMTAVLGATPVSLSAPGPNSDHRGISLYLVEIQRRQGARGTEKKPPLQLLLRYLVSVQGDDPIQSHRQLWQLLLDAERRAQANEWILELEPPPAELWLSFGIPPRPAFVLGIPLQHQWRQPRVPRVATPPELQTSPGGSLVGQVVGPGGVPIAGARVELPSLGQTAATGPLGRFRFSSVPSGRYRPTQLVVKAKGETQRVKLKADLGNEPLIIRFHLAEAEHGSHV
jgi:hypothetical protein